MATPVTAQTRSGVRPHLKANRRRRFTTLLMLPFIMTPALPPTPAARAEPDAPASTHPTLHTCIRRDITVTVLEDTHATRNRVTGWHCRPDGPHPAAQVLLTSLMYAPVGLSGLSAQTHAVGAAQSAGTAVYLIRGIGVGVDGSDPEPSDQVVVSAQTPTSTGGTAPDALGRGSKAHDPVALPNTRAHVVCYETLLCAIGVDVCERNRPHDATDTPLYATVAGHQLTPLRATAPDLLGSQQRINAVLSPLDQALLPPPSSHVFACRSTGDHQ